VGASSSFPDTACPVTRENDVGTYEACILGLGRAKSAHSVRGVKMMKFKLAISAMLMATVSPIAMSQDQGLMPDAIPGGDQFEVNCLALIPGGDQFQNAIRQIDDELPEGIPGGDQFDRKAIPGGDQFEPYQISGGDQFVRSCFEGFQDVGLLIPGGDQFDPQALEQLALGEIELSPALIEQGLRMDRTAVQQIANGGGLGFDGFIRPNPNLSPLVGEDLIPGRDKFDPSVPALDPLRMGDDEDIEIAGMNRPETPIIMPNQPDGDVVPVPVPAGCDWTGSWSSTYGILTLVQDGNQVSGDYSTKGFIEGTVGPGCNLKGTFDNRQEQIKGTYEFTRDEETFEGLWGLEGELPYEAWKGRRSSSELPVLRADERWTAACQWTGTWFTPTSGVRMRLVQDGARVSGEIGENLIVEGTTDTACEGRRDIRMEATVTDRTTGADQSMTITMSSGGQRYVGSLGIGGSIPASSVFAGSRASRDEPILRELNGVISDGGGEAVVVSNGSETTAPIFDEPQGTNLNNPGSSVLRWEVSIGSLCLQKTSIEEYWFDFAYGIVWSKMRVFDKANNQEIELAPVGGFPNIKGDKERVWEIEPQRKTGERSNVYRRLEVGECGNFSQGGFTDSASITLTYEVDYKTLGYGSEEEFLKRRRNRVRLLYKLYDSERVYLTTSFGEGELYGDKARTHALADANFCGTCKTDDWLENNALPPTGDGVFSGFRGDDGFRGFVVYDVKRLPN